MTRDIGAVAMARSSWPALARAAIHEAGHACVAVYLGRAALLRSMAVTEDGGWTELEGEEDLESLTVDVLFDRIAIDLGGPAAERALIGSAAAKAGGDIAAATRLAVYLAERGLLPTAPMVDLSSLESGLGASPTDAALRAVLACLDAAAAEAAEALQAHLEVTRGLALELLIAPNQKLEGEALRRSLDSCAFVAKDGHAIGDDPLEVVRAAAPRFAPATAELEWLMQAGPPAQAKVN